MRKIERSTAFKRDYKRELKGKHRKTLKTMLINVLKQLVVDKPLDRQYQDHDLSGNSSTLTEIDPGNAHKNDLRHS